MILETAAWVGASRASTTLRESLWAYPLIETVHVLGICLFAGLTSLLDLRLLGVALRATPVSEILRRVMPWTWAGFGVMTVTGLLLLFADPERFLTNVFFQVKLAVLLLAGINAATFHLTTGRRLAEWDRVRPPRAARMAGAISLGAWTTVIVTGRMIAYNWF